MRRASDPSPRCAITCSAPLLPAVRSPARRASPSALHSSLSPAPPTDDRAACNAARIDRWFGNHTPLPDATLVVLPTDAVVAYATPGSPAQVVVSRGLTKALGSDELDAVISHELAHLRNRHHRDLVLAGVVDATSGWIPGLRASTAALRLSIERSADEEAAERPGAREATRRALLKTTETMLSPVPAFTAAFTLLARLDALATPPAHPSLRQRIVAFAPLAGLAVVAAVGQIGRAHV